VAGILASLATDLTAILQQTDERYIKAYESSEASPGGGDNLLENSTSTPSSEASHVNKPSRRMGNINFVEHNTRSYTEETEGKNIRITTVERKYWSFIY
jgi:hypothetical protein